MKNIALTMLLIMSFSQCLIAQEVFTFGVKAGVNVCIAEGSYWDYHLGMNIQDEQIYSQGASVGVIAGIVLKLNVSERVFFAVEPAVMTQKFMSEYYLRRDYTSSYSSRETPYTKLNAPVLFGVRIFKNADIIGGPGFSLLFSEDVDEIPGTEFTADLGFRYHIHTLAIDVRVHKSFTNLYDGSGIGYLDLMPYFTTIHPVVSVCYFF